MIEEFLVLQYNKNELPKLLVITPNPTLQEQDEHFKQWAMAWALKAKKANK